MVAEQYDTSAAALPPCLPVLCCARPHCGSSLDGQFLAEGQEGAAPKRCKDGEREGSHMGDWGEAGILGADDVNH